MAKVLHSSLETLTHIDFTTVPIDDLQTWMRDAFSQAEIIANSVPQVPDGTVFEESTTIPGLAPDSAKSAADVKPSEARLPGPKEEHESLQQHWGKPVKVAASSNPLGMTVWKMAGADRHGAWFARRSVHEGMGFSRWKKAMQGEFAASVCVTGAPGAGSIRGVGADARLENKVVDGLGRLEVWQLSAQFPKPVSARQFVTLLLTTDQGLKDQPSGGRYYMVVSIPVEHATAQSNADLVRGFYESVEMIREVPVVKSKDGANDADLESNPVEWLMVTRSDPGGGIPRFMVERSTPASITADAKKFVDWAAKGDNIPGEDDLKRMKSEADVAGEKQKDSSDGTVEPAVATSTHPPATAATTTGPQPLGTNESLTANYEPQDRTASSAAATTAAPAPGYLSSITSAVQNGIEAYVPNPVLSHLPTILLAHPDRFADETDSSDTDSVSSFESAHSQTQHFHDPNHLQVNRDVSGTTSETSSLAPPANVPEASVSAPDLTSTTNKDSDGTSIAHSISGGSVSSTATGSKKPAIQDKELAKIIAKRRSLAEKYTAQEAKDSLRQKEIDARTTKESEKKQKQLEKERRKNHDRYMREIAKIEERQRREERKVAKKLKKDEDRDEMMRLGREAEEARSLCNELRAENEALKAQLASAQRELTSLVREVGSMPQGAEALKKVQVDVGADDHSRAGLTAADATKVVQ